jgi:uncharacterized protein YdiU (UPF0061 family)
LAEYRPETAIIDLGSEFYDPVEAADFPKTILRYRDDQSADAIGLELNDEEWVGHFGRFAPLPGSLREPLALRYHGHQFRHYNPDLGDGRGFLFAQARDADGRLLDLGTKGSGQTPWSRQGDGRLTLLGGVREVLATRYLEHMGVNTSRSLSLIETGEALTRGDEPSPTRSAVLVRLSHSHIRFGTFQRLFFLDKPEAMERLIRYCCTHFYPDAEDAAGLLEAVVAASADTVASWMAAGFVHGVMNTDNMNITGESFDYGPYRFLPHLDPSFTAAYFDHGGLYAFGRQPEAMGWNLAQLAQALSIVAEDAQLIAALDAFAPTYRARLSHHVLRRLHLSPVDPEVDAKTVAALFRWLESTRANWPWAWHDLAGGLGQLVAEGSPNAEHYEGEAFEELLVHLRRHAPLGEVNKSSPSASLLYEEIGALWAPIADADDWSAFESKLRTLRRASQVRELME